MTNKRLSYEELMDLALKNYNEGGDVIYECWGVEEFRDYEKMFGPMTEKEARSLFRVSSSLRDEAIGAASF